MNLLNFSCASFRSSPDSPLIEKGKPVDKPVMRPLFPDGKSRHDVSVWYKLNKKSKNFTNKSFISFVKKFTPPTTSEEESNPNRDIHFTVLGPMSTTLIKRDSEWWFSPLVEKHSERIQTMFYMMREVYLFDPRTPNDKVKISDSTQHAGQLIIKKLKYFGNAGTGENENGHEISLDSYSGLGKQGLYPRLVRFDSPYFKMEIKIKYLSDEE